MTIYGHKQANKEASKHEQSMNHISLKK